MFNDYVEKNNKIKEKKALCVKIEENEHLKMKKKNLMFVPFLFLFLFISSLFIPILVEALVSFFDISISSYTYKYSKKSWFDFVSALGEESFWAALNIKLPILTLDLLLMYSVFIFEEKNEAEEKQSFWYINFNRRVNNGVGPIVVILGTFLGALLLMISEIGNVLLISIPIVSFVMIFVSIYSIFKKKIDKKLEKYNKEKLSLEIKDLKKDLNLLEEKMLNDEDSMREIALISEYGETIERDLSQKIIQKFKTNNEKKERLKEVDSIISRVFPNKHKIEIKTS